MDNSVSDDLQEAIETLKSAEKQKNIQEKIRDYEQGFEMLDQCLIDTEPNYQSRVKLVENLKKSYARAFLSQLPRCMEVDFGTWFDYMKVIFFKIDKEISEIENDDAILESNLKNFINLHVKQAVEILSRKIEKR